MTGLEPAVPGRKPVTAREQPPPRQEPAAIDPDRTVQLPKRQLPAIDPERTDQFEVPAQQLIARAPAAAEPTNTAEPTNAAGPEVAAWLGAFRSFSVGDPGRAAGAPSYPDPKNWDRPDTVLDGVLLNAANGSTAMQLRAASVRGRSHRYESRTRQDAYAYRCDGRFIVAAVADGVSAAPLSHVAANIVSRQGCNLVAKRLETAPPEALDWSEILGVLAGIVIGSGRSLLPSRPDAEELGPFEVAEQLSTTVLFAVVQMRPVDGYRPVHVFSYGDTSAWILRSGTHWEPLQPVKNEGTVVASSDTKGIPIVPRQAPPAIRTRLGSEDTLLLVTDGIGDPLGDGTGPVGAFLAQMWRRPPEPLAFAAHVDFARKSHDDDRTAVAIWPTSA